MPRWDANNEGMDLGTLAGRVRWARLERGMTQAQVADLARISLPTVNRIEAGTARAPFRGTLALLAGALRVSELWLATGAGKPGAGLVAPETQKTAPVTE